MANQNQHRSNPEWENFENAMRTIIRVPHAKIKATLDEENKVRQRKRTRSAKVRAFREANQ